MDELFEIGSTRIDPGITLIEASAGTGKTYAIAGMVVRLITERGFAIGDILVVTFTEAATLELRDRVRNRIRDALILLEEGKPGGDKALTAFEDASGSEVDKGIRHLKDALLSFDEAAIFTIHGFCQRMLRENAFETGALFEVELLTDASPIWRETVEDFWRKQFYGADEETGSVVAWLQAQDRLSTEQLLKIVGQMSRHPELVILTGEEPLPLVKWRADFAARLVAVREIWRTSRDEIEEVLKRPKILKKAYEPAAVDRMLGELAPLASEGPLPPTVFSDLARLTPGALEEGTRSKKPSPEHPFFDACGELVELLNGFERLVRAEFIDYVRRELPEAKRRRNVMTFDDLLTRMFDSLKGAGGEYLSRAIGGKFKAALIDEFQDTDPVQWEIFRRVFGGGQHLLFLIGDPKQAIYGFRGADIFTYIEARSHATRRYTLGTNWRSDRDLVQGANQLFRQHPEPFVFPEITFQPVQAAEKGPEEEAPELDLRKSGLSAKPLQLVCVSNGEENFTVGPAKQKSIELMLGEIGLLLTSGITRRGRPLEPADIAILVRTNDEAELVRECFVQENIPAVIRTNRSVLETGEAEDLLRLLAAIMEPHKDGLVRGALAGALFGRGAREIFQHIADENGWQAVVERFHGWQEAWKRHGFMRMFRPFFLERKERLLALPDGERMVTNYQHAAECIHCADYELRLTPSTLLRWLREQRERPEGESDNHIIRLEKDEKAIQIVTLHRSKGLEYPVVFCPFNWTSFAGRNHDIVFHDEENGNRLTWDLRGKPDEKNKAAFRREARAEAMRLLYVGVTRARNRCYLFWAQTRDSMKPDSSVLAHLFQCDTEGERLTPLAAFNSLGDAPSHEVYEPVGQKETSRYELAKVPPDSLRARTGAPPFLPGLLITSFSGLTAAAHEVLPDRDALVEIPPAGADPEAAGRDGPSIFTFPKGAKAGNFFHSLLEELDFCQPESLPEQVKRALDRFRFDRAFAPVVLGKVQELLALPLHEGVKLSRIAWEDRLVEAPFYYPIRRLTPRELARVFKDESLPADYLENLGRLEFYPVDGYMTGFIDLIIRSGGRYFVIDWKSNWLGPSADHYSEEALRRAMSGSYYFLQYHLYTLALHRHLCATLADYDYERDFGGVFYLFLRGIDQADPSSGVFFDRPSRELVEKLEQTLMPERVRIGETEEVSS